MEKSKSHRIELFWNCFLKCDNEYNKQNYLELFLYEFYKNEGKVSIGEKNSLLSSVPSQLSCHVLQMIYSTICTSINDECTRDFDSDFYNKINDVCYDKNIDGYFKRNLLKKSSEQKHIISLREFLLSGTGGRILETLQCVGINNIPCGRELSNLLINLFPSASWNDSDANGESRLNYVDAIDFIELINKVLLYDVANININAKRTPPKEENFVDEGSKFLQNFDEYDILNENIFTDITDYSYGEFITDDFKLYLKRKIPSKHFSKILINLLILIAQDENLTIIDKSSSTIQSLQFALEKLKVLKINPNIFYNNLNCELIRAKLLILFIISLNNIFLLKKKVSSNLIDLKLILKKLVEILEHDIMNPMNKTNSNLSTNDQCLLINLETDIIFGIYYFIFIIINNCLVLNIDLDYEYIVNLINQFNQNQRTESIFNFFNNSDVSSFKKNFYSKKIINILIKIIVNIKSLNLTTNETNSATSLITQKHNNNNKINKCTFNSKHQNFHHFHHDINSSNNNFYNLKCLLENLLLNLICYDLSIDKIKLIIKYFHRYGFCCCNCNINVINILFNLIGNNPKLLSIVLTFLKNNIIKTMLNPWCDLCLNKMQNKNTNSNLIQKQLINNYINLINNLNVKHVYLVLEHLSKLSIDQIPNELSLKIIFQVTHPIFEKYRIILLNSNINLENVNNNDITLAKQLICSCLNIFSNYINHNEKLNNIFFTNNLVEYLNELIVHYELVPNIFRLIKIGLLNLQKNNLNENVYQDLISLPIESTINITKKVIKLFHKLNKISDNCHLRKTKRHLTTTTSDNLNENDDSENMNILYELRLAAVYWNMTLQLLQASDEFKNVFKENFNSIHPDTTLINLVYNLLNVILNLNEQNIKNTSDCSKKINLDKIIDETDLYSKICCDELYDIYNKHDLYNFNSLLNINDKNIRLLLYQYKELNETNNFLNNKSSLVSTQSYDNYETIIKYYELLKLKENFYNVDDDDADGMMLIPYQCNNIKNTKLIYNLKNSNNMKNNNTIKITIQYDANETINDINLKQNESIIENVIISVSKIHKFLWKYFTSDQCLKNDFEENICLVSKEELHFLYSAESKKICFQLFEIILRVVLVDLSEKKMSSALKEIKKIIISHGNIYWDSIDNGTAILNLLQSLLRISKCRNDENINSLKQDGIDCATKNEWDSSIQLNDNDSLSTDMDCSDDDNLSTEDEGYEADAENHNISEADTNSRDKMKVKPIFPVSNFRTCIIHNGVSKLIIEILFEFCNRCTDEPTFWPAVLNQILTRLAVIRDSLGGSMFLLKGFNKILIKNDDRLIDIQRSILELITNLNTPEALSEYLKLFASKDPPINLLLPRLCYLINNLKIEPAVEIIFPNYAKDTIVSCPSGDEAVEELKSLYQSHKSHQINSGLAECKFIVPINSGEFKPWNSNGFTVSTWIKCFETEPPLAQNNCENNECFTSDKEMVHLFSLGNKNLLLSIYLTGNDGNVLSLHLTRPNEELNERKTQQKSNNSTKKNSPESDQISNSTSNNTNPDSINANGKKKRFRKFKATALSQGLNIILDNQNGNFIVDTETDKNIINRTNNDSILSNTFKNTKTILKNSLMNFQLFSPKSSKTCFEEIKPIEIQDLKLPKNKWMHLCFSVEIHDNGLTLQITLDGTEKDKLRIYLHQDFLRNIRKNKSTMFCIGSNRINYETNDELNTTKPIGYKLSNLILFKECIQDFSVLATLTSLGPDFVNFNYTMASNIIPNMGLLNNNKVVNIFDLNACDSIKILQNLLIGIYSAHEPSKFLAFDFNKSDRGEIVNFITCGSEMKPSYVPSIQSATILCGGISPIIILFGRVVELSNCSFLQSTSLQLVLKIIFSHVELYTEFIKCSGISMMGSIIRTKKCIKNLDMLRSIVETACEGSILSKKCQNEKYQIISQTNACVVHSELLISIIVRYWDWYDPEEKDSDVLDVLFGVFLALVREKHPHHAINVYRLTKAGIIPAMLNFCKIYLVGASRSVFISKYAAENLVNLVRVFAGAPPLPSLLDDIVKLLILMHRPSDSFVTHDRSKFYFLLTPSVPHKQKRIIIPNGPSKLNSNHYHHLNKIRERKLTLPVATISPRSLLRSMSFNYGTTYHDESWTTILDMTHMNISDDDVNQTDEGAIQTIESQNKFSPNKDMKLYQCNNKNYNHIISKLYTKKHKKIKKCIHKKTSSKKVPPMIKFHKHHKKMDKHHHSRNASAISRFNMSESETNLKSSVSDYRLDTTIFNELSNANDLFKAYKSPGFIRVQECFFNLLRDFILILPDNSVDEVLNHYVTMEILIVLSNHSDVNVRTAIVNLLSIICDRLTPTVLAQHTKNYSWFHLANQVSLNSIDCEFLNACIQFITGNCSKYEEIIELDDVNIRHKGGLNLLIASLYQTVHDQELALKAMNVIELLYTTVLNGATYMIENGLIYAIVKTLIKSYTEEHIRSNAMRIDKILNLLTTIAFQAFTSSGAMTVLWDILNCLTFVEQVKVDFARVGARNAQAKILIFIIDACTVSHTNPTSILNFKIKNSKIVIPKCNLSSTELKTRFDLILDRSVQFITNAELTYQPIDTEIKLIFQIIDLSLNGYVRCCNSVILWALCPSRQVSLTISIIRLLSKIKNLHKLNCDIKTIKIFSQSFILANRSILNENDLKMVSDFNNSLEGPINSSWNLQEILNRMEFAREMTLKEMKPSSDRAIYKMESIAQTCIESAMKITRNVVELQNVERRFLMNHMRSDDDKETIMKWHMVIQNMTHEGAPWYFDSDYPNCWELDHTEGPNRVLLRFKRCHSNIDPKFFLEDYQKGTNKKPCKLLQYLMTSISEQCNFCANDQVLHNFNVKHLSVDCEMDGELIITESQIIFMPGRNVNEPILYDIISITEIWTRRYQHRDVALELFLDTGNSMFIIMNSSNDRETLEKYFSDKIVSSPDINKLSGVIQQWKEGQLTNWEYLILLNQMSGRTYHDLMQYPVFPWILSDYESMVLDLNSPSSFRILEKPIAIQHKSNEAHYINNYEYLSQSPAGAGHLEPYHYGSHYSNSGTVLHFLVRLLPFTKLFLHYQDNSFDIPDRTFHAVKTTWRLASKDSPTDVKELIPQFFSLPEMFENNEGFNFGVRQSGESVNNVILPQWCENSPRLFTLIHRQALEAELVRKNLNYWIDLIFGYKQDGQPAIDAINVFHPATYYGFSCKNMSDPVEKMACETMVKTYGQMPRKLFKSPHSSAQIIPTRVNDVEVLPTVKGLKWGLYTGSPSLPNPVMSNIVEETSNYSSFLSLENTNVIYAIPEKCNIMQGIEQDTMNLISWNENDNVVRIKPICDINVEPKILINISRVDPITACGTNINSNQLWFGHNSGRITVYYCSGMSSSKYNKNRLFQHANFTKLSYNSAFRKVSGKLISRPLEFDLVNSVNFSNQSTKWHGPFNLIRHTDQINVIKISVDFKIAVSAGRDGMAVIWDTNRLQYIRVIETSTCLNIPEIYLTEISSTLGDIITVYDVTKTVCNDRVDDDEDESFEVTETNIDDFVKVSMNLHGNCVMRLHTINGKYVNHVLLQEKISSLCFSNIKEGTGVNVILTGMQNGLIKIWSSWNLCFINEICTGISEVISLTYSTYQHLVVLNNNNIIQVWESPGLNGTIPKLYFLKDNKSV